MQAAAKELSTHGLVDTKRTPRLAKRRNWPEPFKRQVVAETLPGSSVSIVARRHDLNTNQLFKWRRELRPAAPPAAADANTMLPVEIVAEPERRPARRRVEHRNSSMTCRSVFDATSPRMHTRAPQPNSIWIPGPHHSRASRWSSTWPMSVRASSLA